MNTNLLLLNEFKEFKELKRTKENYQRYLKTLANCQLGIETNLLLDEFSNDECGKDFSVRVQLVLSEIASRADEEGRTQIEKLKHETIQLL